MAVLLLLLLWHHDKDKIIGKRQNYWYQGVRRER